MCGKPLFIQPSILSKELFESHILNLPELLFYLPLRVLMLRLYY